jgi:hypothetical protein
MKLNHKAISLTFICLIVFSSLAIIQPITVQAQPSATNLRNAITYGRDFLNRLYKPLDQGGYGVLSEYYGCPIRVYYIPQGVWSLAGMEGWGGSIDIISITSNYEEFVYHFLSPNLQNDAPRLRVKIWYTYTTTQMRIGMTLEALNGYTPSQIRVYIGNYQYSFTSVGQTLTYTRLDSSWDDDLQSFRYAVRHGNTEGYKTFRSLGYHDQEYALWKLKNDYGFTIDIYDSAWFYSLGQAGYPFDFYGFSLDAYHDGDVYSSLPRGSYYYPYHSKVIMAHPASTLAYIYASRLEVLVPTLNAIHGLMKWRDPDKTIMYIGDPVNKITRTARQWARALESSWWIGYGIKDPSDATVASGVRTAVFAILETILGYDFGDTTSRSYADQAINILLQVQIPQNGQIPTEDYGTITRRLYKGAFLASWTDAKYSKPQSWLRDMMDWFNMPDEYKGIVVTNQETVQIILRALEIYLDRVYSSECQSNTSPYMIFSERDYFNTGVTIRTKSLNFPSSGTYTIKIVARDIDDKDGGLRQLRFYIDGVFKAIKFIQGYDNTLTYTDYFTSGSHNIGVALLTWDHSTSDGTKPTWAITATVSPTTVKFADYFYRDTSLDTTKWDILSAGSPQNVGWFFDNPDYGIVFKESSGGGESQYGIVSKNAYSIPTKGSINVRMNKHSGNYSYCAVFQISPQKVTNQDPWNNDFIRILITTAGYIQVIKRVGGGSAETIWTFPDGGYLSGYLGSEWYIVRDGNTIKIYASITATNNINHYILAWSGSWSPIGSPQYIYYFESQNTPNIYEVSCHHIQIFEGLAYP